MSFLKSNKKEEWILERSLLDSLIQGIGEAVVVYDKNFKIVNFNKAAENIFGVKMSGIIGKVFSLDQAKNFQSKILSQVMFTSLAPTVVRRSSPGVYPQVLDVTLEDPPRELLVTTNRVVDSSGEVWGFVKIVSDRTREKELLRAKSDFITIAAHQLRTPATSLGWALDTVAKDKTINKESGLILDKARKTAKNLLDIINDLLNVAQIEEGKFGYNFKKIDLVKFLDKLLSDADIIAKDYGVQIYFERPKSGQLTTIADQNRLGQVVSNLIDNAIKYNVANGQVTVKADLAPDKSFVVVSIKDTGVGIPAEDLDKLFTKFFRSKNTTKGGIEGSGLGLYLAKNIINRHGGKIWVESQPNRGSTFFFTVPTDKKLIPFHA